MKVKFNYTGTHIHKGRLLIRLDLYPDPTYKTYTMQNINVFARELTQEEKEIDERGILTEKAKKLQRLIPTKKQLNPFLCHFIAVDLNITKQDLKAYIKEIFDKDTLEELDDILSVDDRKLDLEPLLRDKLGHKVEKEVKQKDISTINERLVNLEVER